ncbi:MAG TPA: DUF4956 domain-containing protein, partial [Clostridiales bacterium UBA8960]|nr:DUF4956 domain-containing protein [Clostridiales bacterium UBA8960]
MFETLFGTTASGTIELLEALATIFMAFLCGMIISSTYRRTSAKGKYSENFALTMILLPAVISIIILLIGSNIARAFSLAGAFSIIRFRSAPGEPKDIAYVLFAMASGLACGVGAFIYAGVFTILLCLVMVVLSKTFFKSVVTNQKQLNITIPEDLDYEVAFVDVFMKYTSGYELRRIKTTSLGSLFQLTYL